MKIDSRDIVISLVVAFLLVVGSFLFFRFLQPYHLFFKEQTQLFLYTSGYFLSYFERPAALACLTGDFLTQFFYLRGGGAMVIAGLLLVEWMMVYGVFKRFGDYGLTPVWALFPVMADWILVSQLHYTLSIPVALIFGMIAFRIYGAVRKRWLSFLLALIGVPLLYSVAGIGMLLFALLVLCDEIYRKNGRVLIGVFVVGLAFVYPLMVRHFYLLTVEQAYLLPSVRWLFILAWVILLIGVVVAMAYNPRDSRTTFRAFVSHILVLVVLGTVGLCLTTDLNREKQLLLASEAYLENWDKVRQTLEKEEVSGALATYYANLSLMREGLLDEELKDFDQPLFLSADSDPNGFNLFFSNDIFFYQGDMDKARYLAMRGVKFQPQHRSSRMIRRLAEVHLALSDSIAAEKYLRILDVTLYHKEWAERKRQLPTEAPADSLATTQIPER